MKKSKLKDVRRIDLKTEEVDALLKRAEDAKLDSKDLEIIRAMANTILCLSQSIDMKSHSIKKLLGMLFGSQNEQTSQILKEQPQDNPNANDETNDDPSFPTQEGTGQNENKSKNITTGDNSNPAPGHGRNGADRYTGAEKKCVQCEHLKHGERCPKCGRGNVYDIEPGVIVKITAEAPVSGKIIELQKLRCNTCGEIFTAELPEGVDDEKYDAKSIAMVALLHYGAGMPFNRLEKLQESVGIPLPSSTQYEMVEKGSKVFVPVLDELIDTAAQGDLLHNDDTTAKILELMGKRRKGRPPDETKPHRSGIFTTGIISQKDDQRIALFYTGTQHAGENLEDLLKRRKLELSPPIQMCDGLSHNVPTELKTILSNCVVHSRRKFVETLENFPEECRHVILELAQVYRNDAKTKELKLNDDERLAYHKKHSKIIMDDLKIWMVDKIDKKEVEPNSGLGQAINYSIKRWEALTLFLRKPGAPLDNNICERALKKSILTRKNSLFYKTRSGAKVGDLYMSLIHTCELNKVNPLEYLRAVLEHQDAVAKAPREWMPWNFKVSLTALG